MCREKGCIPDPIDKDDYLLGSFVDKTLAVPDSLIYSDQIDRIENQGLVPSCVGYGTTTIKELADKLSGEKTELSPIWLYDQCKRIDGSPYEAGTYIRTAMKILAKKGCAPEKLVPYDGNYYYGKYKNLSIDEEYIRPYRIKTYARLVSIDDMLRCLSQHGPFSMGVLVTDGFEKPLEDGLIPIDSKSVDGGHCIACIGYSIPQSIFYIVNSWGYSWGNNGIAKMPFDYFLRYGMDAWGIVDISPNEI